jgi:hypothetical protein
LFVVSTLTAGRGGAGAAGGAGSPFPAQVRYKPTRVKQSLTMAGRCTSWECSCDP